MRQKYNLTVFGILVGMLVVQIFLGANILPAADKVEENLNIRMKSAGFWNLTGSQIFIDDADPNFNWSKTAADNPWCAGNGSWENPYLIENVTIDGQGAGINIEIRNSNSSYFRISNCSLYNGGTGIKLYNVSHGLINDTSMVQNIDQGLYLEQSENNTISWCNMSETIGGFLSGYGAYFLDSNNNTLKNSTLNDNNGLIGIGIILDNSNFTTLLGNNIGDNDWFGIFLASSSCNLSWNRLVNNGLRVDRSFSSQSIDTTNTVNDKPLYYLIDQENALLNESLNAGQIILHNVNHTIIENLNISFSTDALQINNCKNVTVRNNTFYNNSYNGIKLDSGDYYKIYNNTFLNNSYGITVSNNGSLIFNNTLHHNGLGVQVEGYFNNITDNEIFQNRDGGISLWANADNNSVKYNNILDNGYTGVSISTDHNEVSYNIIKNHQKYGISISGGANIITHNTVKNNQEIGISVNPSQNNNLFYNNTFEGNTLNAMDNGTNNKWDNGTLGNYWDNYGQRGGYDLDDDGKGDIWYNVNGSANANDTCPIWEDGEDVPPVVTITDPLNDAVKGATAPSFAATIVEPNLNTSWYALYNQSQWSENYTFSGSGDTINQTAWNWAGVGTITLRVFANDSKGYLGYDDINMTKDLTAPTVTILSPQSNHLFNGTAPGFSVEILDGDVAERWYILPGGIYRFFSSNETFNPTEWAALPNGTATIWFYANDSVGNVGSDSVVVRIDVDAPRVSINGPSNNTWYAAPFTLNATVFEANNDTLWADIGGWMVILENHTDFTLTAEIWNALPQGQTLIRFYANDSAGNLNDTYSLLVYKDTHAPNITLTSPATNQLLTRTAPSFSVLISDPNLQAMWYSIDNGATNFTFTANSTINQTAWETLWDSLNNDDSITIRFYANDTFGHLETTYVDVKVDKSTGEGQPPIDYDLLTFLLVGIGIAAVVGMIIIFSRGKGYKSSRKEADRIDDIVSEL